MEKKAIFKVLPEDVKSYLEIFESKGFKEFMALESEKTRKKEEEKKNKPLKITEFGTDMTIMCGGKGRSYLNEYLETLPAYSIEDIREGKADGRMIIVTDIGNIKNLVDLDGQIK